MAGGSLGSVLSRAVEELADRPNIVTKGSGLAAEHLAALGATLWVAAGALGYGRLLVPSRQTRFGGAELLAIQWLAGCGTMALLLFVLGIFQFTPIIIVSVVSIGATIELVRTLMTRRPIERLATWLRRFEEARWLILCIGIIAFLGIAGMASPVGDIGHDGISYHRLGIKHWLMERRITPALDHSHTAFPATEEVLLAATVAMSNDRSAGLFGVFFGAALLALVYGLAQRLGAAARIAALSAALVAAMPVAMNHVNQTFVDAAFAAMVLAALRCALDADRVHHVLMAAVFAGFAIGTKYTGLLTLLTTAVIILIGVRGNGMRRLVLTGTFVLMALLIGSPWYVRNWITLGSPIFPSPPIMAHVFATPTMPEESTMAFHRYIRTRGQGLGRSLIDLLLLPVRFTYITNRFHGAGGIGLMPLALAPLGVWGLRHQKVVRLIALWLIMFILTWFLTQQEARFAIPWISVLAVFGALGCETIWRRERQTSRWLAGALVAISGLYGTGQLLKQHREEFVAALSASRDLERRQTMVPYRAAFDFLNSHVAVGKVLVLHPAVPTFYLDSAYVKPVGPYGERPLAPAIMTAESALDHARQLGVTHVLDTRRQGGEFLIASRRGLTLRLETADARVYAVLDE